MTAGPLSPANPSVMQGYMDVDPLRAYDFSAGVTMAQRYFWYASAHLDPGASKLDEGVRFSLCRPDALADLFVAAGLERIDVTPIDIPTPFTSVDDYWQPFLGGQGPAPAYAMSLTEAARAELRECLRERLPVQPEGLQIR